MIKKLFISFGVLFSFFLMFLFGFDNINILAYSDVGSALGSYPVKIDIDNYDTYNLYDSATNDWCEAYRLSTCTINNDNIYLINTSNNYNDSSYAGAVITKNLQNSLEVGKTYTFQFDIETNGSYRLQLYDNWNFISQSYSDTNHITFSYDYNYTNLFFILVMYSPSEHYNLNNLMLYEGSYDENKTYATPFKFGYNVNYSLAVNNLTSSQLDVGIAISDVNGNYLKTGTCVIPVDSTRICNNLNDPLYLPFNIDNNGYISFNYSLGLFIGPVGSLSVIPNDSGFNFVPVFNAYYKGSSTDNLYFKDRYTFNNLFLSGFNVSVNSSTLSKVIFPRNQVDSEFSMNTNKIVNFATDKKIGTGIYNYINYVDFINSSPSDIYSFVVTTGVASPNLFENRIYTISFSNFSLKVNGDTGNVTPLPNNPNTINKYNECSAWYDIPCQLGNGLTYVIYEAPIISPVLTFIVSFITMFSSLVSFVDLFRSFGIVFGCFVIYMFINLLHKYSK